MRTAWPARPRRSVAATAAAVLVALAIAAPVTANPSGFRTEQAAMITPRVAGATAEPLVTVGDTLAGGYRFEALPDGIALASRGNGRVDVYVNHETSLVPFPYVATGPTAANSLNDFDNAQLSHLILSKQSGGILHGDLLIESSENYQRFCSNFLATAAEGFDRELLFTNEEATDVVNRAGVAWPATAANGSNPEQAGVVVAVDVRTGQRRPIYGMGRHNHENSVAVPGLGKLVVLSGDDTFTTNPAQSQVYAYMADSADDVWNDRGTLYGFKSDVAGVTDYYDVPPGSTMSISGHWEPIPADKAHGDQAALEAASDAAGVFQFVRIEDIAYDKRPGMSNVVYLADSGRASASPGTGNDGQPNPFPSTNGRIWKMVLDPADPLHVLSLSILHDADTSPLGVPGVLHQPDNLETTPHGVFITEDPSSPNRFALNDPNGVGSRLWWYHLDGPKAGQMEVAFEVDQSADEGPTDVDPTTTKAVKGEWEVSGVVDASAAFGPGAFLLDVQAHSLFVEVANGPDLVAPAGPDWLSKREGGQLLLVRIPGA